MARFDNMAVMQKMAATRMVPVFYHKDVETAKRVVKACYDGGVRLLSSPTVVISPMRCSVSW